MYIEVEEAQNMLKKIKISELEANMDFYFEHILHSDEHMIIETEKGNAVMLSESQYCSMLETIYLLSQPGLLEKIKNGEKEVTDEMSSYDSTDFC